MPTGSSRRWSSWPMPNGICWRADGLRRPGSIVSTNTSGLPIAALAAGRSDDFRRHWLGTHFFNPPRHRVCSRSFRRQTPIPRSVGRGASPTSGSGREPSSRRTRPTSSPTTSRSTACCASIEALEAGRYSVEEIDAITGPALGRPKSATFRTADLAGLDAGARRANPVRPFCPNRNANCSGRPICSTRCSRGGWATRPARASIDARRPPAPGRRFLRSIREP